MLVGVVRAKVMLHGDGADKFKRVYDLVRKHNSSSTDLFKVLLGVKRPLF